MSTLTCLSYSAYSTYSAEKIAQTYELMAPKKEQNSLYIKLKVQYSFENFDGGEKYWCGLNNSKMAPKMAAIRLLINNMSYNQHRSNIFVLYQNF